MTKLDLVLASIRELPPERQEAMAAHIGVFLDQEGQSLLSDEQWADVEAALADEAEPTIANDEVFARLRRP